MTAQTKERPRLGAAIAATSLGFVVVQLDVSIVNVALDRIGRDLGAGIDGLSWVVDAYTLTFAAGLLSGGAIGDRIGARRAYCYGLVAFAAASLACALAPSAGWLIAARAAQGIGAAVLMPCSLAALTHACGDDMAARAKAIGIWTAMGGVALAAGPPVGGALIALSGWQAIFLANLPVGAAGVALAYAVLSETEPSEGRFDLAGQILGAALLFSATATVIEAGASGLYGLALWALGLAIVSGAAFFVVEAKSPAPLLPLGFFRDRTFSAATIVGFGVNFSLYGMIFLFGLVLQRVFHTGAGATGLAFLPLMATLSVANILSGRLAARLGSRLPMTAGMSLAAIAFAGAAMAPLDIGAGWLTVALIPIFAGVGTTVPAMTAALLASAPRARAGVASGVLNTVRQTAGAMGVATFGALAAQDVALGMERAFLLAAALLGVSAAVAYFGIAPARS